MNETMKNELNKRFDILEKCYNLSKNIRKDFFENNTIYYTEQNGALYWCNELGGGEKYEQLIKDFEKEHKGCHVYFAIHTYTEFGELLNLMYISDDEQDWAYDKNDLLNGITFCYVYNLTDDWCSEFGTIGIKGLIGGLVRAM